MYDVILNIILHIPTTHYLLFLIIPYRFYLHPVTSHCSLLFLIPLFPIVPHTFYMLPIVLSRVSLFLILPSHCRQSLSFPIVPQDFPVPHGSLSFPVVPHSSSLSFPIVPHCSSETAGKPMFPIVPHNGSLRRSIVPHCSSYVPAKSPCSPLFPNRLNSLFNGFPSVPGCSSLSFQRSL